MHTFKRNHLSKDQLQPALLDRLTDHAPHKRTEALDDQTISKSQLRGYVLRDLTWLLNTINAESIMRFQSLPHVAGSAVNYGIPAFSGNRLSDLNWNAVEDAIRAAIIRFEPRLLPQSLEVRLATHVDQVHQHNTLHFEIHAQLWSQPYPLEILLQSNLDLETGQVIVQEHN